MLRSFEKLDVVEEIIMHNTFILGKELHTNVNVLSSGGDPHRAT
jgi:hypothetical protein